MIPDPLIRLVSNDYLDAFIASFIDECRSARLSARTIHYYESNLKRYRWWCSQANIPLDPNLHTPAMIRQFFLYLNTAPERWGGGHSMSTREMTPSAIDTYYRVLRRFYNWLVEQEYIDRNPMSKVRRAKVRAEQPDPFTSDELELMAAVLRDAGEDVLAMRDRAIVAVLLDVGVRVSELCDIQLSDLNMATGELYIRSGKGDKPRPLRLGSKARRVVRRYLLKHRRLYGDDGPLFLTNHLDPITRDTVRQMLRRLGKSSGVQNVHPHRFRHTAALNAVRAGMNLFELQMMLGHTTLEMTRRYVKLVEQDIALAASKYSPLDHLKIGL